MKNSSGFFSLITSLIVVSIILFLSSPAFSKKTTLEELLLDIRDKSAELTSLTCDFTQKRSLALFNKPIVFEGRLTIVRPDKLRWEFLTPVPSVLIFDGNKGIRCTDNNKPARFDLASDPVMRMVAKQLWTWLDGDYSKLKNDYSIKKTGESSILVTPEEEQTSDLIKNIAIVFDTNNRQPKSVTILEPGGDETLITFRAYQLSPMLSETTFTTCFQK